MCVCVCGMVCGVGCSCLPARISRACGALLSTYILGPREPPDLGESSALRGAASPPRANSRDHARTLRRKQNSRVVTRGSAELPPQKRPRKSAPLFARLLVRRRRPRIKPRAMVGSTNSATEHRGNKTGELPHKALAKPTKPAKCNLRGFLV